MNAIANVAAAGAIAALGSLKTGLQNVQQTIIITGGDPYLRLLQDGSWVYGQQNVEVQEQSLWAVNPLSLKHGFVSWTDHKKGKNEVVGEAMVSMNQPLPDRLALRDTGWPWAQQLSISLQCMSGEDEGTQVLYKTTAVGGMNAVNKLIGEIMTQLDRDPDRPVPVLHLLSDHYQHPTWGKTYFPVLHLQKWTTFDGVADPIEDAPVAPAAAAAAAEVKPTRTRRQPAAAAAGATTAPQTAPAEDPELAALEAAIAAKKAKLDADKAAANAATVPVDPAAARRAELQRQLAELDGTAGDPAPQAQPEQAAAAGAGQTLRRRRPAA